MRDIYESAGEIIWQNNGQEWSGFLFNSRRSRISNTKCPRVCVCVFFSFFFIIVLWTFVCNKLHDDDDDDDDDYD